LFLKAPRLNPELKSGLRNNSVIKKDEYNSRDQDQEGIACFWGSNLKALKEPEIQQLLTLKHDQVKDQRSTRGQKFWPIFSFASF